MARAPARMATMCWDLSAEAGTGVVAGTDLGAGAVCYRPGDVATLAGGLARWFDDPDALRAAGEASWAAARRRWHWRHPAERGALVAAVERVVS